MKWNAKNLAKLQKTKNPKRLKISKHWTECKVIYFVDNETKTLFGLLAHQDDFDFKFKFIVPKTQNATILFQARFDFNLHMNRLIQEMFLYGIPQTQIGLFPETNPSDKE